MRWRGPDFETESEFEFLGPEGKIVVQGLQDKALNVKKNMQD